MALIVSQMDVAILVNLLPTMATMVSTSNASQQAERERLPFVCSSELSVLGITVDRFAFDHFH